MSKLRCICGHVISGSTDNLSDKAYFLPDEDANHALDNVISQIAEFIEARERGEQEQYLQEHYFFPRDTTVCGILYDDFVHPTFDFGRGMHECETCGHIWMQAVPDKNEWVSYLPESGRRGILRHQGADPETKL
jgi:hypothetical protein